MGHLGPENVRRDFKGMVERCADCGFDLAGGRVEVVPTAHYMMGGVEFAAGCTTALTGLFVAGEDSGGVHGANRLGGNGVANSTVFGGIAGDAMAAWVAREGSFRVSDARAARFLDALAQQLHGYALPTAARVRAFNLTWHDWLNLTNLVAVSRAIVRAAVARENSRGAHFRADFPDPGDLEASAF